ncbi:MAG TPA: hypothetical protein VKS22_10570 [Candidatus Binataceae bacterium]|nr:hypothetical protein [Candidatus Binataceae bacterium]
MSSNGKAQLPASDQSILADASGETFTRLLEKVLEDSGKVIHAETRLLIANTLPTIQNAINVALRHALKQMSLALSALFAFAWLTVSAVALLHQWFLWWQSAGIVGGSILILVAGMAALDQARRP